MNKSPFIIVLLFCANLLNAQPFHREVSSIPVIVEGDTVGLPFAGGINTPNHQFVDIDGDGDPDLFIFDNDLNVDFYRNEGTRLLPHYVLRHGEISLPPFLTWFLFPDLDGDGLLDLVTDDSLSGVRFYKNTGTVQVPNFILQVLLMLDSAGNPVQGAPIGVPAFVDLDGDGLQDFLSSNLANGSLNYYRNIGTTSNPIFKFITDHLDNILVLGDTCTSGGVLRKSTLHGGAALRFADLHRSGTKDLFYGDLFSHGLFQMANAGTSTASQLQCTTNRFPDISLVTFGFNQSSFIDIDGDGDLDLFAGVLNNMYRHGFWLYENTGDSLNPAFILRTKDYLSMIDAGGNSSPALVDLNGDHKLDLVVGADQSSGGVLWYFENVGTQQQPAYVLTDTMFAGISGNNTYAPAFADLNNDGLPDMAVGQFNGAVKMFLNVGTPISPQYPTVPSQVISVGPNNASPAFVDIDIDGDQDLFIGKSNGKIVFYRNDGDSVQSNFILVTTAFDGISVGENAKPFFADIDNDADPDLFIGNTDGKLFFYENVGTSSVPQFALRQENFGNIDPLKDARLVLGDIDNDGDLDLVVGNLKGGLGFYRNGIISTVEEVPIIPRTFELQQNYPNPFNPKTDIRYQISVAGFVALNIYDLVGREVAALVNERKQPGVYAAEWNAFDFPSGVYYYRLTTAEFTQVRSMVLIK